MVVSCLPTGVQLDVQLPVQLAVQIHRGMHLNKLASYSKSSAIRFSYSLLGEVHEVLSEVCAADDVRCLHFEFSVASFEAQPVAISRLR